MDKLQNLKLVLAVVLISVLAIAVDLVMASGGYEIVGGGSSVGFGTLTDTKLCIYTTGTGIVCNTDPGAAAAAGDTSYVQYNTSDLLDAEAAFAYSASLNTLTVGFASTTGVTATTFWGALVGNAGTASALAANGGNCSAGQAPLGIDASGAVESCFDAWTEAENTAAGYFTLAGWYATTSKANLNAGTATALAADPADCSANTFANAIAASGALTCASLGDADVPNNITVTAASSAAALLADPTDCSANQFANAIAASGNLTCSALTDADIPDTITASGTALAIDGVGASNQFWMADGTTRGIWKYLGDAEIPDNITVTAATSAAALSADPTDCSANQFATTIAANGNLTCAAITDNDVPDGITASGTALAIDGAGTAGMLWMSDGATRGIWRGGGAANTILAWGTVGLPTWISTTTVTVGTALKANNVASSTDPAMTFNLQNVAINTTVASSGIRYHDGTAEMALNPYREKSFVIASSTLAYMAATGTTTLNLINWPRATTVTQTACIASAGTAVYQFSDGTNLMRANAIANTLKVYTEGTNNTFIQNEGMSVAIGTVSGVGYITCTVYYYQSAD